MVVIFALNHRPTPGPTPRKQLVHRSAVSWAGSSALPPMTFPRGIPGTRLRFDCSSGLTFLVKDQGKEGFAVCNVRRPAICTTCQGKPVASRHSLLKLDEKGLRLLVGAKASAIWKRPNWSSGRDYVRRSRICPHFYGKLTLRTPTPQAALLTMWRTFL
jgi:hypothetical protein